MRQMFLDSPDPRYQVMGERYLHPESYDHFIDLWYRVQSHNDVLYIAGNMDEASNAIGSWFQSDPIRYV